MLHSNCCLDATHLKQVKWQQMHFDHAEPKRIQNLKCYHFAPLQALVFNWKSDLIAILGISFLILDIFMSAQTMLRGHVCLTWQRIWIREQRLALTRLQAVARERLLSCGRRRRCRAARVNKFLEDRIYNSSSNNSPAEGEQYRWDKHFRRHSNT